MIQCHALNTAEDLDDRLERLQQSRLNLSIEILDTLDQVNIIQAEIEQTEQAIRDRLDRL